MHFKRTLDAIIAKNNVDDMKVLGEVFEELYEDSKLHNRDLSKDIKYKLHKLAYGHHLTKEMAEHWVECMENKDGTKGAHWSFEQAEQYAGNHNKCDWYAVFNMMYSDYFNPAFDTSTYVKLANDWLDDKDVGEGKTLKYYLFVVKS